MSRALVILLLSTLTGALGGVSKMAVASTSATTQTEHAYLFFNEKLVCTNELDGQMFMRTELIFGMSRSGGPDISEAEFQRFIDDQVTPRFPEGLTLLNGNGQFKDSTGAIVQEKSKVLILLYPFGRTSSKKVEDIRRDYREMFQQESVLRIDEQQCVSF